MAKIIQPIKDFLTKLRSLSITNAESFVASPVVRIWNNQLKLLEDGNYPSMQFPAFFVEVVNDAVFEDISQGFRSCDILFRVHIVHQYFDAQDGTFEQDLPVFDIRDMLVQNLTGFILTACGPLNSIAEAQDYSHRNLYHYTIDFVCNFTDSTGSRFDNTHPAAYVDGPNPTALTTQITIPH